VQLIPSVDVQAGRSRLVYWPGAASGTGAPTDRPERIARTFVEFGAPLIHLVDLDGARAGKPVNSGTIQAIARAVATPLQVAGGIDGPEQIELAFAAGATRVVMPALAVAEEPERLAACLRIAGDWLAVGLDARPERLAAYPWRGEPPAGIDGLIQRLVDGGVRRLVLSHAGAAPDVTGLGSLARTHDAEFLVAGGVHDLETLKALQAAGVHGVILGEALLSGALDYRSTVAALA
jgi:phosphoribosylformimino-5-aminoimidazole carboxamide ribotide isomerase